MLAGFAWAVFPKIDEVPPAALWENGLPNAGAAVVPPAWPKLGATLLLPNMFDCAGVALAPKIGFVPPVNVLPAAVVKIPCCCCCCCCNVEPNGVLVPVLVLPKMLPVLPLFPNIFVVVDCCAPKPVPLVPGVNGELVVAAKSVQSINWFSFSCLFCYKPNRPPIPNIPVGFAVCEPKMDGVVVVLPVDKVNSPVALVVDAVLRFAT